MAPSDFGGKVALVTGGGSGIGRETCLQLARDGARVAVTDVNLEGARHTLSLLPGGGAHLALQMDVTQKSSVEAAFAAVKEKFGASPRLLVNSAGILNRAPFVDLTLEKMCTMMDIHVKLPSVTPSYVGVSRAHRWGKTGKCSRLADFYSVESAPDDPLSPSGQYYLI